MAGRDSTDRYLESRLNNLFLMALYHWNVRVDCRCRHHRIFEGHQLWWLYHRKLWNDHESVFARRMFCSQCWSARLVKVRPCRWEKTRDEPTGLPLPWPDEREWKRMLRRYRS